tara:strand:- start:193 stop:1074 length:882 start_codon:yes stop_codon:yes gene_type:complete
MQFQKNNTLDTQTLGLEVSLAIAKFVTGKENMHYGVWDNLDPCLENLGKAQEQYTKLLFKYFPKKKKLKILDIGGGAGETAKKLISLDHSVTVIVPSDILSKRCLENTNNKAKVHNIKFEDYEPKKNQTFDLCLFSESFQYIPAKIALEKAKGLLSKDGQILVADCFRSDFKNSSHNRRPGGGHPLSEMLKLIKDIDLNIISKREITRSVAPSLDIEQKFYNVVGVGIDKVQQGLVASHPWKMKLFNLIYKMIVSQKKRKRLHDRIYGNIRNSDNFIKFNHYMILQLSSNKAG